ncbi:MAG: hypothetical protein QOE53_1849 [Pseudonocardiales bacterium]|jgi:hypothetical protein|nr:hypothetical protein [Pseudonocardiales bacterium]
MREFRGIEMQMSDVEGTAGDNSGTVMDRRALLRASGVVAGIAGIGGYAAARAPAAAAAEGDPLLAGADNDAGTGVTTLISDTWLPTLILANIGTGAQFRLAERAVPKFVESGDLVNVRGDLRFAHGDLTKLGSVYTSYSASQLVPVRPFRVVDTRTAAGRANIVNRTGNLDSTGRLKGGPTIEIDLGDAVFQGTAVFANLTATQASLSGYLTLWPSGSRPGTSSLNYSAGHSVANFCVSGLKRDRILLYASTTTHVVLDVVAFAVGSPSDVHRELVTTTGTAKLAGTARKAPAWHTSQNG